jgi:hypothetical protein
MTSNCPNYSQALKTESDFAEFNDEEGIHKVYLFSSKDKPSPIYLALTNQFRNRVRFAFVSEDSPAASIIAAQMGVSEYPTLLIKEDGP